MEHPTPQASLEAPGLPAMCDREPGLQTTAPRSSIAWCFSFPDVRFLREGLPGDPAPTVGTRAIAWVAEDQNQALEFIPAAHPDAVLVDTALPSGFNAVASIVAAAPNIPVIALAMVEAEYEILTWVEAGIAGIVPRSASISDIVGSELCSSWRADLLRQGRGLDDSAPAPACGMTRNERYGPVCWGIEHASRRSLS